MHDKQNMDEWQTNSVIEQETIRAVVETYAKRKIELEKPESSKARNTRYAPSFRVDFAFNDDKRKPYNAESIARFLGWMSGDQVSPRVRNALKVLEAAESLKQHYAELAKVMEHLSGCNCSHLPATESQCRPLTTIRKKGETVEAVIARAEEAQGKPLAEPNTTGQHNRTVDNVNGRPTGNASTYLTRRIARDRPDILDRMKAGEFPSVRQQEKPRLGTMAKTGRSMGRRMPAGGVGRAGRETHRRSGPRDNSSIPYGWAFCPKPPRARIPGVSNIGQPARSALGATWGRLIGGMEAIG